MGKIEGEWKEMDKKLRASIRLQAEEWIFEAGEMIRNKMSNPFIIDTKTNKNDLVTEVDKKTEKFFAEKVKETYPSHLLLGEEGYGDKVNNLDGTTWIIDPIDGTTNFVHLKKDFAISIGIYHDGIGEIGLVYDVMNDIIYSATKGGGAYKNKKKLSLLSKEKTINKSIFSFNHDLLIDDDHFDRNIIESFVREIRDTRTIGSAALEIVNVAEGNFDGYVSKVLSPWDVAAGYVILNEVGGVITRSNGEEVNMLEKGTIISSNAILHEKIIDNYFKKWCS